MQSTVRNGRQFRYTKANISVQEKFFLCMLGNIQGKNRPRNGKQIKKLHTVVDKQCLTNCNGTRIHKHLVREQTLNQLASLAKWLSVHLQTKWLGVRVPLQSLKLQILRLFLSKKSLDIQGTIDCGFTLKHVRDMIRTYSQAMSI